MSAFDILCLLDVRIFFTYDDGMRVILHIDFDSFFASCEQQFNPQFREKPLGVTAHNGRTAIIAASREAKKQGVRSPSRTFEAQAYCPELILTTAHFEAYWNISKKFINICNDYSPFVEVFSLDEVFMDVTKTAHLFGGVSSLIAKIKHRIREEIGEYITVSVGLSHNKLLAKLASGWNKPNGFCEINNNNKDRIYNEAKLTDVCGIGERSRIRLNSIGIFSLSQLGEASLLLLVKEFGNVYGRGLKQIGLGIDVEPVIPYTDPIEVKSVGRNYCLPRNEYNQKIVLQNLYELCEEVALKLRRLFKKARTIGVSLRGSADLGGRKTYKFYFDNGSDLFYKCIEIINKEMSINEFFKKRGYIRQISIWAANLEDNFNLPISLFSNEVRQDKLNQAIDKINEKFGNHTIRNGFLLYADKLTTQPNGYMADKYERTKLSQTFQKLQKARI